MVVSISFWLLVVRPSAIYQVRLIHQNSGVCSTEKIYYRFKCDFIKTKVKIKYCNKIYLMHCIHYTSLKSGASYEILNCCSVLKNSLINCETSVCSILASKYTGSVSGEVSKSSNKTLFPIVISRFRKNPLMLLVVLGEW